MIIDIGLLVLGGLIGWSMRSLIPRRKRKPRPIWPVDLQEQIARTAELGTALTRRNGFAVPPCGLTPCRCGRGCSISLSLQTDHYWRDQP